MEVYGICVDKHATGSLPFISHLKIVLQVLGDVMEPLFYVNQRKHGPSRPFIHSYKKLYFAYFGHPF